MWPARQTYRMALSEIMERVDQRLAALKLSDSAASAKAGISVDAIRNMRRALRKGQDQAGTTRTWQKLAEALDTNVRWLLTGEGEHDATDSVVVVGYVAAGDVAVMYSDGQGGLDRVPRPQNATANTVAAEIRGTSLGPALDGWLVYYDDVRSPVTPDLYGQLCVVGLPDGRIMVKRLRHAGDGRFHLLSNGIEEPMLDQYVDWAARVTWMSPR